MRLSDIKSATTAALTQLKKLEDLRLQHDLLRAAWYDVEAERDHFHLVELWNLADEIFSEPAYGLPEKACLTLRDLKAAVTSEIERSQNPTD